MKGTLRNLGIVTLALTAGNMLFAQEPAKGASYLKEIAPFEARAGQTLIGRGENLNQERVIELYLSDGKNDYRVEILEQSKDAIRFKLPGVLPEGKLRAALVSDDLMILEQPVFVRIVKSVAPSGG